MSIPGFRGLSSYDMDLDVNECAEKYFSLILALAKNEVPSNIGPVDSEDVAQEVFIKLILIAEKRPIQAPKAYIRRIIHTVVIDMTRKYKPHLYQALPVGEDGELKEGNVLIATCSEEDNPEVILREKEAVNERMKELVDAISKFHPRQRYATVCTLRDRVEDLLQFIDALQENGIDSESQWPDTKSERQKLQASFSFARKKLATLLLPRSEVLPG